MTLGCDARVLSLNISEQENHHLLAYGWNLIVQPALRALPAPPPPPLPPGFFLDAVDDTRPESFHVDSAQRLRILWGPMPAYAIWVPETITVTLPAVTILSNHTLVASPQLVLWAEPGTLRLTGAIVEHHFETTIQVPTRREPDEP